MWLFNLDGFFSVVEHRDHPSMVCVRARYRSDLEKVAGKIGGRIRVTPERDYPYRMVVPKEQWVVYVATSAAEINYGNFKKAALKGAGPLRDRQYHEVWATMAEMEEANAYEDIILRILREGDQKAERQRTDLRRDGGGVQGNLPGLRRKGPTHR